MAIRKVARPGPDRTKMIREEIAKILTFRLLIASLVLISSACGLGQTALPFISSPWACGLSQNALPFFLISSECGLSQTALPSPLRFLLGKIFEIVDRKLWITEKCRALFPDNH